ncbi:MAG: non-reducing end alpha-L-arabinofuranosidase family hydrolase [Planctomycetota bacterium]
MKARSCLLLLVFTIAGEFTCGEDTIRLPKQWEYSAALISPETRDEVPSRAQKDPTLVQHEGRWHVFMTVKLPGRSAIEYCSFDDWKKANESERIRLPLSESDYFCAPQVFYFRPHRLWYLVYQVGNPDSKKMWVAYSTTNDINQPHSWTKAKPMLDGGPSDPRTVGGLDYWIICDDSRAHLFLTSLKGKMWRLWTTKEEFPNGFRDCELALRGKFFEASHTYRVKDTGKYLTLIEQSGKRFFKAYEADQLDGPWTPIADTRQTPFAADTNIRPAPGVSEWTDNVSHGELIRAQNDERLLVDLSRMRFVFQGLREQEKSTKSYGGLRWRIGVLTAAE